MRKPPRNGARAQDAHEPGPQPITERTAEELDPLAKAPPPPLVYRDESPDAVRGEPGGRQRAVGEAKEVAERVGQLNVTGQARQKLLGKLREAAGSTGEMAGQLLGMAMRGSIAAEEQVRRIAARAQRREESAGEQIERFSTETGHEAQERAGRIGMWLAEARARGRALGERSPIELSPKAAGILTVVLGLVGMGGVVVLRRMLRERQQRRETEREATAKAAPPPRVSTLPEAVEIAIIQAPPAKRGDSWRRRLRR